MQWRELGAAVQGMDFPGAAAEGLLVPGEFFAAADLSKGFAVGQVFDLTQCLEVAEHLPRDYAADFIVALAASADIVLFSAAPPGQGGDNHINEQPYEYWRDLWRQAGFDAYDWIRPLLRGDERVAPWYRYNMLLFANAAGRERLPAEILETVIPSAALVPDEAPPLYRLRRLAVRCIPPTLQSSLARLLYSQRRADAGPKPV